MPPRSFNNPAPLTESARKAREAFFCSMCQKGYSRVTELETHEGSYDHQHKKRLKEMKEMQKDPNASRKAEKRDNEKSGLLSIKPVKSDTGLKKSGGFKKGGFISAFNPTAEAQSTSMSNNNTTAAAAAAADDDMRDGDDDMDYEYYDPNRPTECEGGGDCDGITQN